MTPSGIDFVCLEDQGLDIESLPESSALGCWFSSSTASTASCPLTSASSATSASTFG
ncbi:MAG: thiocillin family RiPP [Rhodoglobus sp.]|uniref:thiocillin family RiPP n=1 Tax=Pengzhenrongella phosphoraccumulans TaxID=3114394 RepID=UPI00388EE5DD